VKLVWLTFKRLAARPCTTRWSVGLTSLAEKQHKSKIDGRFGRYRSKLAVDLGQDPLPLYASLTTLPA
jgi:hypothetical protein